MSKHLIREDEYGLYVQTGGYIFRPVSATSVAVGDKVNASHRGGTETATVAGELWASNSDDPRGIELWKRQSPDTFERHVQGCYDLATNNVSPTAPGYNNPRVQEYYSKRYTLLTGKSI